MRNPTLIVLLLITIATFGRAQCVIPPRSGIPGFCPPASAFPCIERGQPFEAVLQFENFDTLGILFWPSTRFDSVTNLPAGISVEFSPDSFFESGQTGCITFSGLTNDTLGTYRIGFYIYTPLGLGGMDGELSEFEKEFYTLGIVDSTVPRKFPPFYLRVVNPGTPCPSNGLCLRDSLVSVATPEVVNAHVFPNPATDMCVFTLPREITGFDLQIFDATGRLVQNHTHLSGSQVWLDVKTLNNGNHFYRIVQGAVPVSKGKLLVMK